MRLLFSMDKKDYDLTGRVFERPSVRAIIVKDGKLGMVYSEKQGVYRFPGGGIETGETHEETLIREVREEAGLLVIPSSIRPYGYVHRIERREKSDDCDVFIQDNFYYLCQVEDTTVSQSLDESEKEIGYELRFVKPKEALLVNERSGKDTRWEIPIFRESMVLSMLLKEGMILQFSHGK